MDKRDLALGIVVVACFVLTVSSIILARMVDRLKGEKLSTQRELAEARLTIKDWVARYDNIRNAAEEFQGKIMTIKSAPRRPV